MNQSVEGGGWLLFADVAGHARDAAVDRGLAALVGMRPLHQPAGRGRPRRLWRPLVAGHLPGPPAGECVCRQLRQCGAGQGAGQHVSGVVHAGVDARVGHQRGERVQRDGGRRRRVADAGREREGGGGEKGRLSRENAAARLHALADALARHNDIEFDRGGMHFKVHVPDEVDFKLEIEIEDDERELEDRTQMVSEPVLRASEQWDSRGRLDARGL